MSTREGPAPIGARIGTEKQGLAGPRLAVHQRFLWKRRAEIVVITEVRCATWLRPYFDSDYSLEDECFTLFFLRYVVYSGAVRGQRILLTDQYRGLGKAGQYSQIKRPMESMTPVYFDNQLDLWRDRFVSAA